MSPLSAAKERILLVLKTKGPQTSARLAKRLGVTAMAVRQHLAALEAEGLVEHEEERGRVGRPRRTWQLRDTKAVRERFPDSHADLTLGLLRAARTAFGEKGVNRLLRERAADQLAEYRARIPDGPLDRRVATLAAIRRDEGYMAEWRREAGGGFLLVENHCPVCAAATECQGLCRFELDLFRRALGDVDVERTEHILEGARRCAYRIRPVRPPSGRPLDSAPGRE